MCVYNSKTHFTIPLIMKSQQNRNHPIFPETFLRAFLQNVVLTVLITALVTPITHLGTTPCASTAASALNAPTTWTQKTIKSQGGSSKSPKPSKPFSGFTMRLGTTRFAAHFAVASKKRKLKLFRFSEIITSDRSYFADVFALFCISVTCSLFDTGRC